MVFIYRYSPFFLGHIIFLTSSMCQLIAAKYMVILSFSYSIFSLSVILLGAVIHYEVSTFIVKLIPSPPLSITH